MKLLTRLLIVRNVMIVNIICVQFLTIFSLTWASVASLPMNLRAVQIFFFVIAILFTASNIHHRFFTKKVTQYHAGKIMTNARSRLR